MDQQCYETEEVVPEKSPPSNGNDGAVVMTVTRTRTTCIDDCSVVTETNYAINDTTTTMTAMKEETVMEANRGRSDNQEPYNADQQASTETPFSLLSRQLSLSTLGEIRSEDEEDDGPESNSVVDNAATKRDGTRVIYLKLFVVLILVVSATIIAVVAFLYMTNSEIQQFHAKFRNDGNKVLESIGSSIEQTLGALNAISVAMVSYAADQGDEWPLVSLPNFALQASKLLPLTDGLTVVVLPIVVPTEKKAWEEYAYQNDYWVNETIAIQEVWGGYHGDITYDWPRSDAIYGDYGDIPDNVSRFMLPMWHSFPLAVETGYTAYNWDWNSEFNPLALHICIEKQLAVFSEPYMIPLLDNPEANAAMEEWARFNSAYLPPDENSFEPMFDVDYPIVNDVTPAAVHQSNQSTTGGNQTVVGIVAMSIYWRSLFRYILPKESNGIVVVVHNPCNRPFTYQIDGPQVTYLGVGDRHNTKYDRQELKSRLVDLNAYALRDSVYSGAQIDDEFCPYTLNLYPSDTMKDDFVSHDPTYFMVSVLLIFAFASCVFFAYDWYVEQRQYRIKSVAIRSSAIVSSLFPSTVRGMMYASNQDFNTTDDDAGVNTNIASPIAQVYTDTTVLFADIVGFTNWCSSREPTQVFQLLETLYAGFDALAKVHGVFKIETIGDSYVAVVGLPKRRKRHAVIMAKFADDMRAKMIELTTELEECLGPGTSSLGLRIGLNSGPTTAGVLRGEKARFQLFGDTVNTAARMETNSAPFRIHVSASTADLIVAANKGYWLEPREEKIDIKGKGLMQTFWCNPSCSSNVTTSSTHNPDAPDITPVEEA